MKSLRSDEDALIKLIAFLDSNGKKYIIVEPGFHFVKPYNYSDIVSFRKKRGRMGMISTCKWGKEPIYVIHT